MKESPKMMKREIDFMKKKGAPKAMVKHEVAEAKGMKKPAAKANPFAKGKPFACGGGVKKG